MSRGLHTAACLSRERVHGRMSCCTVDPTFNGAAEVMSSGNAIGMVGCLGAAWI